MAAPWENIAPADLRIVRNHFGKIVYRGPRVGVLVHSSRDIRLQNSPAITPASSLPVESWPWVDLGTGLQNGSTHGGTLPSAVTNTVDHPSGSLSLESDAEQASRTNKRDWGADIGDLRQAVSLPADIIIELGMEEFKRAPTALLSQMGFSPSSLAAKAKSNPRRWSDATSRSSFRSALIGSHAVYSGDGLEDAEILIALVHPGQVVVTESVWKAVHTDLPALAQV